uniref:CYTOSOL_AP domain-containing protein n=1 Tax=Angiostrongylus cantonensis TaxID=6313 RepID=A0A0K0D5U8_ANGCA
MAHQASHPSGVSKLVPDLSGRIAALARYIGWPPRVIAKLTDDDISYLINLACWIREVCRLVDAPPNELTTDAFLLKALCVAEQLGVKQTVISGEDLKRQNFGGIYNVGKAGSTPPAFAVLSYEPKDAKETYCLVGKGVVFDTGGMQIKGKTGMPAAAVLGAFYLLVSAKFQHNLHACLCIVENNISPIANKPDDIITMLSGKTVEINNTDAEGRLILADGVYYAKNTLKVTSVLTRTGGRFFRYADLILSGPGAVPFFSDEVVLGLRFLNLAAFSPFRGK